MKTKIDTLQYLRAFAALLVVFNHTWPAGEISRALSLSGIGGFGVDIFFVISGFIMSYTLKETFISSKKTAIDFLIKRAIRIYPVYLILVTPYVLKYLVNAPHLGEALFSYTLIGNLLLLPSFTNAPHYYPLLGVAWTLMYEMFFYFIYAAAILMTKNKRQAILSACALIFTMVLLVNLFELKGARLNWVNFQFMVGDTLMIDFILGACCFFILRAQWPLTLRIEYALAGVIGLTLVAEAMTHYGLPRLVTYGMPAFFVVLLLLQAGDFKAHSRCKKTLMLLGDASYSIYLLHVNFAFISRVLTNNTRLNDDLIGITMSLCAVSCGVLFHVKIEKPLTRKISSLYRNKEMTLAGDPLVKE